MYMYINELPNQLLELPNQVYCKLSNVCKKTVKKLIWKFIDVHVRKHFFTAFLQTLLNLQ